MEDVTQPDDTTQGVGIEPELKSKELVDPQPVEEEQPEQAEEPAKEPDVADEPGKDDTQQEDETTDTGEYPDAGHPLLQEAINILVEANISAEQSNAFFIEAAETGDLSKIDRDGLIEAVGADRAKRILAFVEGYYAGPFQEIAKLKADVYDMVGGEDAYNAMRDWAHTKEETDSAFRSDLSELRDMLNSGSPRLVKAAARELFDMYTADPDTSLGAALTSGDSTGSDPAAPLSRQEYTDLVEQARLDGTYEAKREALWERRKAGMAAGN